MHYQALRSNLNTKLPINPVLQLIATPRKLINEVNDYLCNNCEFDLQGHANYQLHKHEDYLWESVIWKSDTILTMAVLPQSATPCPQPDVSSWAWAKSALRSQHSWVDAGGKHEKLKRCLDPATRLDLLAKIKDQVLVREVTTVGSIQK